MSGSAGQECAETRAGEVVAFWIDAGPDKWFTQDPDFDDVVRRRYAPLCAAAAQGELDQWRRTPRGALALILLLDQFPRNMHRGDARAFATDAQARRVAERAIQDGHDKAFEGAVRRLFYLPFMHAEDIASQERAIALCAAAGDAEGETHAREHADVVRRFGRFPHRNGPLGRASTPEETRFLDAGGFRA